MIKAFYNKNNESEIVCPTDMLKFKPPPYDDVCTRIDFKDWSTIGHYKFDVKYRNVRFPHHLNNTPK